MAGYTYTQMKKFLDSGRKATIRGPINRTSVSKKRDVLIKKGGKVHYYVWGNKIATLHPKKKVLSISSAGWETDLTKNRLNKVLPRGYITQRKFEWYYVSPKGREVKFKRNMRVRA